MRFLLAGTRPAQTGLPGSAGEAGAVGEVALAAAAQRVVAAAAWNGWLRRWGLLLSFGLAGDPVAEVRAYLVVLASDDQAAERLAAGWGGGQRVPGGGTGADGRGHAMSPRAEEALLSFQLSRWATRTGPEGKLLTLDLQDRGQWDRELIADGGGLSFACPRRAARPVAAAGRARHLPRHRAVLRGHGIAEWGRRSRAFAEQLPVKKPKQQKG